MRKWIVLLLIIFVLSSGFVYFIIPNKITIQTGNRLPVNAKAFARTIYNEASWQQWWPGKKTNTANFVYNNNAYTILERKLSSLLISIKNKQDSVLTELVMIPVTNDTMMLNWVGITLTSTNPVTRIQKYQWVKRVNNDLQILLQKLQAFYNNEDHLYGFHIRKELVKDSALVTTSTTIKTYPDTKTIYSLIERLQTFTQRKGIQQTGAPMLNITPQADSSYITRVAMPVNKTLHDEGNIQFKWMMYNGNILVTEVKGNPSQIQKAFAAMSNYVSDHHWTTAAIPFQSLVTDRRTEPDSSKWVTKVYWPVM